MATQTLISVDEYLRTTSEPDCEYVRGVLTERAMPTYDHAAWQTALLQWFGTHKFEWNVIALAELRMCVFPDEFRIPDVTILSRTAPREQIITHPPLAVFEILSPSDSMSGTLAKLDAYQQMGIPAIWLVDPGRPDPAKPISWRYSSGHLSPVSIFELPGTSFSVAISEIAALLD
jgi:Uma2 family endonuclease